MQGTPPDAVALVKKYGRTSVSFQTLSGGMRHWFGSDALVGYAATHGAWVAVGSPIAAASREIEVMEQFAQAARQNHKRVRFFAVERDVAACSGFATLHVGEQPIWNPQLWPTSLRKRLRGQIRRANAKGTLLLSEVRGCELSDLQSEWRRGMDAIVQRWLRSRRMAPMGFIAQVDPYRLAEERRYFIAEQKGRVVAALVAIPIYARNGWFFELVLRVPEAPNGTIEVLFDFAMKTFASEGVTHVTFGLSPLAGTPSWIMREIRDHTGFLYNFAGLRNFKAKLGPQAWQAVYLAYPRQEHVWSAMYDVLCAFTPHGPLRFAFDSLGLRLASMLGAWDDSQ